MLTATAKPSARTKILGSALAVIRAKGYAATSVDDLCAVAAADFWSETTSALFASAPYHAHRDPLQRVLAYIDFRKIILIGGVPEFTCLAGTMVQETYETNPAIRDACARAIFDHAEKIETDIAAAIAERGIDPPWTAASLALYTQAVLQGAFILAKARGGAQVAADTIDHLRRYVELLFDQPKQKEDAP
jgi:TetR/AcrR family transcriptional repressor of nem operon